MGSSNNSGMDEVKSIITLRSGRETEQPVPMTAKETYKENEAEPERVIISEDPEKKKHAPSISLSTKRQEKNPKPS